MSVCNKNQKRTWPSECLGMIVLATVRPRRANLQVIRPLPRHLLLFQTLYLQIYSEKANSYEALFYATSVYYSCLDSLNEQSESILPNYEKELDTILLVASIPCVFCFLALCERKLSPQQFRFWKMPVMTGWLCFSSFIFILPVFLIIQPFFSLSHLYSTIWTLQEL